MKLWASYFFILFLICVLPCDAEGVISFDFAGSGRGQNISSLTWSHTVSPSATSTILIVGVSIGSGGNQTVSSMTYAGQSLQKIYNGLNGAGCQYEMWYMIAPQTGANNVIVTISGNADMVVGSVSLSGVDQVSPFEQQGVNRYVTNSGNNNSPTVSISTVNNNAWIIDLLTFQQNSNAAMTAYVGRQQQWNLVQNSIGGAGSTYGPVATGGTNVNMSWSLSANKKWGIIAVSLKPVSSGAIPITIINWKEAY